MSLRKCLLGMTTPARQRILTEQPVLDWWLKTLGMDGESLTALVKSVDQELADLEILRAREAPIEGK